MSDNGDTSKEAKEADIEVASRTSSIDLGTVPTVRFQTPHESASRVDEAEEPIGPFDRRGSNHARELPKRSAFKQLMKVSVRSMRSTNLLVHLTRLGRAMLQRQLYDPCLCPIYSLKLTAIVCTKAICH